MSLRGIFDLLFGVIDVERIRVEWDLTASLVSPSCPYRPFSCAYCRICCTRPTCTAALMIAVSIPKPNAFVAVNTRACRSSTASRTLISAPHFPPTFASRLPSGQHFRGSTFLPSHWYCGVAVSICSTALLSVRSRSSTPALQVCSRGLCSTRKA